MPTQTTYSKARANFAKLCDEVTNNREIVRITRRKGKDVALIAADELDSMLETLYLLRSPANAARLRTAIDQALAGEGEVMTIEQLRRELDRA